MTYARAICLNCLELGATNVPIGRMKGPQLDTYRETIALCKTCEELLTAGNLPEFIKRFREERTVMRGEFDPPSGEFVD